MHVVDGSRGEGGGQVLRSAIAVSAATGEPVRVRRIRAGRPSPGLKPQHLTAVTSLAAVCGAEVEGAVPGSRDVTFRPGPMRAGKYRFDVGTAGSVTLLLQALLPACAASGGRFSFDLRGGTDVRWSPPWDYFASVHVPLLAKLGVDVRARLMKRGHYPKGGGRVQVEVMCQGLRGADLTEPGEALEVLVRAHAAGLPEHVPRRLGEAAQSRLEGLGVPVAVAVDAAHGGPSAGCGVTLALRTERSILGADALGEKGVPAEEVAGGAADALVSAWEAGAGVDARQADQLAPYLALAGGGALTCPEATGHLETGLDLAEQLLGAQPALSEDGDGRVRVEFS